MGADLIGYMVVGKSKITDEMAEAATAKAIKVCTAARELMGKCETHDLADVELPNFLPEEWHDPFDCDGVDFLEEYAELDEAACRQEVEEAVGFLGSPGFRDCVSRNVGEDEFCLFCGEMSWGDEPEGGGYTQLKRIHMLGIYKELGLR